MPTSTIVIHVKKFRSVGAVTTMSVDMDLLNPLPSPTPPSPLPPGWTAPAPTDGHVTKVGSYYIKSKRDHVPLDLEFWIYDDTGEYSDTDQDKAEAMHWARFRILGISFSNRNQAAFSAGRGVGQHVFEKISITTGKAPNSGINPPPPACVMTITNSRKYDPGKKESYDYMIFIQDTISGDVGIIDPEYENET